MYEVILKSLTWLTYAPLVWERRLKTKTVEAALENLTVANSSNLSGEVNTNHSSGGHLGYRTLIYLDKCSRRECLQLDK